MENRQLVIVGGGPAGLSAAIYGRRSGLDVLVLENGISGGQVNVTSKVENYPGFKRIDGMELAKSFREHTDMFGAEFRESRVESLLFEGGDKIIRTDKGDIMADSVIISSGASFSKAGCKGETEFTGRGVCYCAVCDGALFDGLPIAVIGGGNSAVEEADYLTQFASRVYLIHRREEFRAQKTLIERALANPKIEPVMGFVVDEIAGGDMVERVVLRNLKSGETREIEVDGVFVFVGLKPNAEFLGDKGPIRRSRGDWIVTNEKMETSVEGVFAAGDVRDKFLRQIVTATGDGATAGMAAYEYLSNQYYLRSALLEPERVRAFFMSSIDPGHLAIAAQIEEIEKAGGRGIMKIDAHRNVRIREKLDIKELPAIVSLERGRKVRERVVSVIDDVRDFCKTEMP
ncbi:MAG: thioredoxin-disulfide reductase [Synergistaceae bacterium]|nr:thioredoxin-disulfide reductase [Synergistaceae bacterium]